MSGYRDVLERSRRAVGPSRLDLERVYGRRDRKRRNQRISAAVLAIAVAGAGLGVLVRAFDRSQPAPADRITRQNISRVHLAWTADVADLGYGAPMIADGIVLVRGSAGFTDGRGGIVAYPVDCARAGGTCEPGWIGPTGDGAGQPAGGDGEVYVTGADCTPDRTGVMCFGKMYAFPSTCPADGATCSPLWTADRVRGFGGVERPIPLPGGVLVGASFFPASCSGDGCNPSWVDRRWSASQDGVVLGREVVMPENDRIAAYPIACIVSGGCDPSWTIGISSADATVTTVGDAIAVVDNADGRFAIYRDCGAAVGMCRPAWTAPVPRGGGLAGCGDSSIIETSGTVFSKWGGCGFTQTLAAYPLDCRTDGQECTPSWTWTTARFDFEVAADGNMYVTSEGQVHAFPASCSSQQRCDPSWVGDGDRMPVDPVAGDGLVWVMSGTDLLAYASDCGTEGASCEPLWRHDVGAHVVWITIDGPRLYVAGGGRLMTWEIDGG
ncbi:MAG: hypothetical protein HY240_07575 [Actinobacteria bacterium]|nr:hypothetical protein [Actinomycetota bacterium]